MPPVSPLKQRFGARLRALVRRSPYRQCDVSAALKISNSAVSQMLGGKIVPRHQQLQTICRLLNLSQNEELELTGMLMNIRNGETLFRSRFNQMFTAACRESGLSMEELEKASGIPLIRLQLFENCYDALPLLEEIRKLAPVLHCPVQDLLLASGLGEARTAGNGSLTVAEPAAEFRRDRGERKLPVIELDCLQEYTRRTAFFVFAAERAVRQTPRGSDLEVPVAAVTAPARRLQLGVAGEVMLLVSEELPPGFRNLELFSDKDHVIRLREKKNGIWRLFQLSSGPGEVSPYATWSLNVLELILRPVRGGQLN